MAEAWRGLGWGLERAWMGLGRNFEHTCPVDFAHLIQTVTSSRLALGYGGPEESDTHTHMQWTCGEKTSSSPCLAYARYGDTDFLICSYVEK